MVGGFNPSQEYSSNWKSSPNRGENKKYLKTPPRYLPAKWTISKGKWLVDSTHLKNIRQIGNLPQIEVKIKNIWKHHLDMKLKRNHFKRKMVGGFNPSQEYSSNWKSSPNRGENKKYLKTPPRYLPAKGTISKGKWLVDSTHLKNIRQIGNLPQIEVKIKNIWKHHLDIKLKRNHFKRKMVGGFNPSQEYSSNWKSSPNRGENKKYLKTPPRYEAAKWTISKGKWLVDSTHLKNIRQIGNLPQIEVKIKNIWKHHLDIKLKRNHFKRKMVGGFNPSQEYSSNWKSSPNRGENKKYLKTPPRY